MATAILQKIPNAAIRVRNPSRILYNEIHPCKHKKNKQLNEGDGQIAPLAAGPALLIS
jgi:hypothetical protein